MESNKSGLERAESRDSNSYCSPWNRAKMEGFDAIPELEPKFINLNH